MSEVIDKAFKKTPRIAFLPKEVQDDAKYDVPLPIRYGQTNSQPSTVKLMLEWLEAGRGDKVLDVGSGSGWTTALLSRIVGNKGRVLAVERIPDLVEFGRDNCDGLNIENAEFHEAGETFGWPDCAPYDRILVSAGASELPIVLVDQLKPGGRLVIPVEQDIIVLDKTKKGNIKQQSHYGFAFVPLVGN